MRSMLMFTLVFALTGAALMAEKAKTPDDMNKAMKKIGTTQQTVNKQIQSMQFADAKKNVEIMKATLTDAENFWVLHKKTDAQGFSKDVIAKLDALDKLLTDKAPDQAKATAAYREASTACNSCHKVYRGVDANNQFVIKPGTV